MCLDISWLLPVSMKECLFARHVLILLEKNFVIVVFQDAPMDLTDINPTIISTDTEDEEHVDGASRKRKKRLSYKNPVVRLGIQITRYSREDTGKGFKMSAV